VWKHYNIVNQYLESIGDVKNICYHIILWDIYLIVSWCNFNCENKSQLNSVKNTMI